MASKNDASDNNADGNDTLNAALDAFREAWYAGEDPDPDDFCAKHPECGDELRERIGNFLLVEEELDALGNPPGDSRTLRNLNPGDLIGPYRLIEELGRGGQGVVFLAEDTRLSRKVALKVLSGSFLIDDRKIGRFEREARIVARLGHPGICTLFESGEANEVPFIAMQYVKGESLAARIARARRLHNGSRSFYRELASADPHGHIDNTNGISNHDALTHVLELIEKTARIVHAAHEAEILHRDLKPANIMIRPDGDPVIMDFGLAWEDNGQVDTLTQSRDLFGTPDYMPPEQIDSKGERLDERGDLYSLGVTLYECLMGTAPFEAITHEALYRKILFEEVPDLRRRDPSIPRDVTAIVGKSLAKRREERYETVDELADDLERFREGRPVRARPASPLLRMRRWTRRNRALTSIIFVIMLVLVVTFPVTGYFSIKARQALEELQRHSDKVLLPYLKQGAEEADWPIHPEQVGAMDAWLEDAKALLGRKPDLPQQELDEFLSTITRVSVRRDQAATIKKRSIDEHRDAWQKAIADIANPNVCPLYKGLKIKPQIGLVPMGMNPDSGLYEFAFLLGGDIPSRNPKNGKFNYNERSALVFVLLPGGPFWLGSSHPDLLHDERIPNLDTYAQHQVKVRHVTLDPFFLSKYEMTQGQWLRLTGKNPSRFAPGSDGEDEYTLLNPVENVTWSSCDRLSRRLGWIIPTDAQWEYAVRGGTHSVWWTGDTPESLRGAANLTDFHVDDTWPDFQDGFVRHAPVGSFRPNPFGFHDITGNNREWVREYCSPRWLDSVPGKGDGERPVSPELKPRRLLRGAGWDDTPYHARSGCCGYLAVVEGGSLFSLGFRPARKLDP